MGAWGAAAGFAGGMFDVLTNDRNQKRFAQKGIQWKVADAKAAGIHPLAALGANTIAYQPTYSGDNFAEAGQNIDRARFATATKETETKAKLNSLLVKRGEIENNILASNLRTMNQPGDPPKVNSNKPELQGKNGKIDPYVNEVPSTIIHSEPNQPSKEAGSLASWTWARTPNGGLRPVMSKDVKERIEEMIIPSAIFQIEQGILPNLGKFPKPELSYFPNKGGFKPMSVYWDIGSQSFKAKYTKSLPRRKGKQKKYGAFGVEIK